MVKRTMILVLLKAALLHRITLLYNICSILKVAYLWLQSHTQHEAGLLCFCFDWNLAPLQWLWLSNLAGWASIFQADRTLESSTAQLKCPGSVAYLSLTMQWWWERLGKCWKLTSLNFYLNWSITDGHRRYSSIIRTVDVGWWTDVN